MRQQVHVTATLTYDADAALSTLRLRTAIIDDLSRLLCPPCLPDDCRREVELVGRSIATLHEEAEIYSNAGPAERIQSHTVEALRKAMADAPSDPRTIAPSGRPYRISSESAWPLRGADGRTFAERKASQLQERPA